jgi:hypothetical protein
MEFEDDLDALRKTADYLIIRKKLRQKGIGSFIFGILALLSGSLGLQVNLLNLMLILIGLLLLGVGIWNWVSPTAEGIIVDGIVLLIVALWNIGITLMEIAAGIPPTHWAIIGVLQIFWSIRRFLDYPKYREALRHKPHPEDLKAMDALISKIYKSKETEAGAVHFKAKGRVWKGLLARDAVIFLDGLKQETAMVARRDEFSVETQGKVLIGSSLKANFRIGDRNLSGTISPESLQKIEQWQGPPDVVEAVEE